MVDVSSDSIQDGDFVISLRVKGSTICSSTLHKDESAEWCGLQEDTERTENVCDKLFRSISYTPYHAEIGP